MSESDVSEFYGLLVPLAGERLLIPRACVAEIAAWSEPAAIVGAPQWYLGAVAWRGQTIPLISFEGTMGQLIPLASSRSRIVVVHSLAKLVKAGSFGILTQGFPQLIRLTSDLVKPDPTRSFSERSAAICSLRLLNEAPLVPNIEYLERIISEETVVTR
jgi:chemosensory pili system protein ChpC